MKEKNSPLTPAERQKRFRQDHVMIGVDKGILPMIDELKALFAKELNAPDLPRSTVFSRIIVEAHLRYFPPAAAVTGNGDSDGGGVVVSVSLSDILVADNPQDAASIVTGNTPSSVTTRIEVPVRQQGAPGSADNNIEVPAIPVISYDEKAVDGPVGDILVSSSSSPVTFPGGKIWKGEGQSLVVKFEAGIFRKEYLKNRGYNWSRLVEKCWSREFADSTELTECAFEVIRFMNATPEEQNRNLLP